MDYFKIFTLIFMIFTTYLLYQLYSDKYNKEGFEGTTQGLGGVDDANSINTLAQIARKLMDKGLTVPGDMNINGNVGITGKMTNHLIANHQFSTTGPNGCLNFYDRNDASGAIDAAHFAWYNQGNVARLWNNGDKVTIDSAGTTTVPVLNLGGKFRLSGVGDAHGNDDWIRLFGVDNKGYSGGIAMNKCAIQTADFSVSGRNILAELNALNAKTANLNLGDYTIGPESEYLVIRRSGRDGRWAYRSGTNWG